MVNFNHPNVMRLRGVCLNQENPLLIMPFMSNGTVLEYVRHNKDTLMHTNEANSLEVICSTSVSPGDIVIIL